MARDGHVLPLGSERTPAEREIAQPSHQAAGHTHRAFRDFHSLHGSSSIKLETALDGPGTAGPT
jgi:hypothetical protein